MSAAPPDIFISYAREDEPWVRPLAVELATRGRTVFWDRRIPAGQSWHSHIGKAVKAARCVVVVWSGQSIDSEWVLEEAGQGKKRRVLVPVLKEPVEPPMGFGLIQAADLSRWRRGEASEEFASFLDDLASILGPEPEPDPAPAPRAAPPAPENHAAPVPLPAAAPAGIGLAEAPEPPSQAPPEPTIAPDGTGPESAGAIAAPHDTAAAPGPLAPIPAARDIPTASPRQPQMPPAPPPHHRATLDPADGRTESSSTRAAGPARLAVLALIGLGAIGAGIYLAAGQLDQIRRSSRTAGQVFTDTLKDGSPCPFCPEMVVIPVGSFTMGSPANEADRDGDEGPQRKVTFAQPFALGRYEVTFAQWDACIASGGCAGVKPDDRGWGRNSRPVINVSWNDAQAFVSWLSRETGESYRLPTEAEWEYAARGGTTTPFWTGATISTAQANYDGNYTYGSGVTGIYREKTVAVDDPSFPANPFGLFHVHGNVWEWVQDCYVDTYGAATADGHLAVDRNDCPERVLRGGSWSDLPRNLRSANRLRDAPESRFVNIGFRAARMLTP